MAQLEALGIASTAFMIARTSLISDADISPNCRRISESLIFLIRVAFSRAHFMDCIWCSQSHQLDPHCPSMFLHSISLVAMPNQTPDPTAVGAVSSAVAVHVAGRLWLSFHR